MLIHGMLIRRDCYHCCYQMLNNGSSNIIIAVLSDDVQIDVRFPQFQEFEVWLNEVQISYGKQIE